MIDTLQALLRRGGVGTVFEALGKDGDQSWLVGGCVRNALLDEPISDIDFATQATPDAVMALAANAGLKAIPTGIDHGTVTLVADETPIEVTTLRKDVATDGRRAVVAFSRDLADDAARRDFTMNALYVDAHGGLHDPTGGLADLEARRLRFIGDPAQRIAEDYLRILRFFRFYAWYGHGAPDRDAIRAVVGGRDGLKDLSAERVWAELKKLLAAPHAGRSLLWMRQSGVYQIVLPESGDMDGFARFLRVEQAAGLSADPLRRLLALLNLAGPDRIAGLTDRLKLSRAERNRLSDARTAFQGLDFQDLQTGPSLRVALYQHDAHAVTDVAVLHAAASLNADPEQSLPDDLAANVKAITETAAAWVKPSLPVKGDDLRDRGIAPGPQLGAALQMMEGAWVASDFTMTRDELLAVLKT